ncbi:MAG: multiheme c-type cytochrome [Gammaproteobacteria bacterium]|nr:multiheme c-type cytochrome [Gammaproteobacteria bacterium]
MINASLKALAVTALLCFVAQTPLAAGEPVKPSGYVTSKACAGCHEQEFAAWSDSHHSWAWRAPTQDNVLGEFDDAVFEHQGFRYRFETEDGRYFITADGPDGEAVRYPLRFVVGVTPLQQYLVETGSGRLQALDVVWDTERKRWYHLYPNEDTSPGNGFHWSGAYKNWNARCAECHATGYQKNYDPHADAYASRQAEIGVGCEACHGPGEAHVAWAKQPESFDRARWTGVDTYGLTPTFAADNATVEINVCATCHARREPLGADSPPPGAAFDDHYRLALLRDGLYFPDGQIYDEVYVYGSFLQSKMYARGVRCTNCHEPHSYALKLQANAVCTQCHNPAGNPAFPTLTKAEYDAPAHHFHEPGSEASACASCHMPERHYMVVDGRRDHSFRIPRPDLAAKLGTPDPCTQCHLGKTPEWAAQAITERFPQDRSGEAHFAEVFAAAGQTPSEDTAQQLAAIANDLSVADIVRASALLRLVAFANPAHADKLAGLLNDESARVRMAAIGLQRSVPGERRAKVLAPLLSDPVRSVRIEVAKALLDVSAKKIPDEAQGPLREAMGELQESLRAKADFPEIQLVIAGAALTQRNLPAATAAFRRAVEMDPQLVPAWMMIARIQAVQGDRDAINETLREAIHHNPENQELRQAAQDLRSRK